MDGAAGTPEDQEKDEEEAAEEDDEKQDEKDEEQEPSAAVKAWRAFRGAVERDYDRLPKPLRRACEAFLKTLKLAYWLGPTKTPDANDEPVPPKPANGDDQAEAAAYGAAVAHVINRPDGIRARAQVSATISAAVAAALAAFAPLTGLALHHWAPQALVAAAVLGWLVSLWRYILVIAYSYHGHAREVGGGVVLPNDAATDATELHLRKFLAYAAHIRARVERGTAATIMALGFTLAAAAALAIEPVFVKAEKALVVSLNDDGFDAVNRVCRKAVKRKVDAKGRPADLTRDVVPLRLSAKTCGYDEDVVVHVRRSWIEAVRRNAD